MTMTTATRNESEVISSQLLLLGRHLPRSAQRQAREHRRRRHHVPIDPPPQLLRRELCRGCGEKLLAMGRTFYGHVCMDISMYIYIYSYIYIYIRHQQISAHVPLCQNGGLGCLNTQTRLQHRRRIMRAVLWPLFSGNPPGT